MNTDYVPHRCPGCGCAEDETPSDDCWLCQHQGELRAGSSTDEMTRELSEPA
jgi:ribosomal protein L37AE/L43A